MVALIVVVVLIAGYLLIGTKAISQKTIVQNQTTQQAENSKPTILPQQTVTLTAAGFTPQIITVNVNTVVIWINKSDAAGSVNSDSYPTNLLFPLLNLGRFDNGSSLATTFTKAGKYTYHNQLNSAQTGTVIVK